VPHLISCCLLLAIVAVWGWTFSLMKEPVETYGVVSFLAVRFTIAAVALGAAFHRRFTWRGVRVGAGIGLVLAASYLLQTFGLRHTSATNTGLITGLFVIFAPLANRLVFGVRTSPLLWGAIGVSLVGLVLLTGTGPTPLVFGDALVLLCALSYGVHVALLDRHAKHHDAMCLAFGQVAATAVVCLALWPCVETVRWPSTSDVWFALLVTALIATAAAFAIQTHVQQRLPAVQTAIIIATEPVFAAFFGYVCVGDRLAATQWIGAVLMVGAMVFSEILPLLRSRCRRM
jgi:drug/metabolite transporter (DMT)-like permease